MLRIFSLGLGLAAAALLVSFSCAHSRIPSPTQREPRVLRTDPAPLLGAPILIRIFKRESELELWVGEGHRYQLYATYPICFWSGKLGPKEREGDRQAPEGFYSVSAEQLHIVGRHPRSFNIGYPNAFDRALGRSGSHILVHGGCTSTGCFAMTDGLMEEIYQRGETALHQGQDRVPVHIFPFRMTDANLAAYAGNRWSEFWQNLKEGYDAFEGSRLPPNISVCRGRYVIHQAQSPNDASSVNVALDACIQEQPGVTASKSVPSKSHRWLGKQRTAGPRVRWTKPTASRQRHVISRRAAVKGRSGRTSTLAVPRRHMR